MVPKHKITLNVLLQVESRGRSLNLVSYNSGNLSTYYTYCVHLVCIHVQLCQQCIVRGLGLENKERTKGDQSHYQAFDGNPGHLSWYDGMSSHLGMMVCRLILV